MSKKKDIEKWYTQEEFEERQRNWKPSLHHHLMWTWWDVTEFLGELSYYLRKLLRWVERHFLNRRSGGSKLVFIDCDTWSLDDTVAELVVFGIKSLRERDIGYPAIFDDEGKEWKEILLVIQEGFEEYINIHDCAKYEFQSDEEKQAQEKVEKGLDLFRKYFYNLWD